jgi:hypothetical protein
METVTREDVTSAYRIYLGRQPESELCFEGRMGVLNKDQLKQIFLESEEHLFRARQSGVDFFVFGNCHALPYKNIIEATTGMVGASYDLATFQRVLAGEDFIAHQVSCAKLVILAIPECKERTEFLGLFQVPQEKIRVLPTFSIKCFHPDLAYVFKKNRELIAKEYHYNSRICLFSYLLDVSPEEAGSLYTKELFQELGYFDTLEADRRSIGVMSRFSGLPVSEVFEDFLVGRGSFMHSSNHPKIAFLKEVVCRFLSKEGIGFTKAKADYIADPLEQHMCFPVYPEVARKFGFDGDYYFKLSGAMQDKYKRDGFDLPGFIRFQYETFSVVDKSEIALNDYESLLLARFKGYLSTRSPDSLVKKTQAKNPYESLPGYNYWRRSVAAPPLEQVDPVTKPKFVIKKEDKVATAGSCFAQHISRTLSQNGFNYFVTEKSNDPAATANNYGVYSARYGNLYSARQLLQLFYRVYGYFDPVDEAWELDGGRLVDPFRPRIQPGGFADLNELRESRRQHFVAVKKMFEEMSVFVFTLGLTEVWRSKIDGAVFPLAPGVAGGAMDEVRYEFVNLGVEEVRKDLQVFVDMLSTVNPKARILLTVSPVSLMATYEDRHVLCSTSLSKSVLRAAADVVARQNSRVDYFPSYEIITGTYTRGGFFEDDFRSVKPEGVAQVMRIFMKNYAPGFAGEQADLVRERNLVTNELIMQDNARNAGIVCDEDVLDL